MKFQRILSLLLCLCLVVGLLAGITAGAAGDIVTTPTGYTKAADVVYKTVNGTIANWGARGEDCVFLSKYATSYYTGSYSYETLSKKSGGSTQSNASSSDLYKALQNMMKSKQSHETSYKETRDLYCYTDCLRNDTAHISSFYSGTQLNGAWDSGKTWNREHTWPNSKGLNGADENDIMMLRPTSVKENSSRGNDAYGEGSAFYDPGIAVRGDCARIVLYVYTRWGNTSNMWGDKGVMESMSILLKWMEEDPVDTWEMGRNDSVQSITGVRNVFVDYPEYAWLLFSKSVPANMSTPSGGGAMEEECTHKNKETRNAKEATCTKDGYSGDTYCADCGELIEKGSTVSALGHNYQNGSCTRCGEKEPCAHKNTEIKNAKEATCTEDGYTGDIYCLDCGAKVYPGVTVKAMGHDYKDGACTRCGEKDPNGSGNDDEPKPPVEDPEKPECYFDSFTDCSAPWYHEAVDYTVANGLMKGVGEGLFDPNGSMTRGMIVTVLYRAAGSPEAGASSFTDVKAGEWYADAIAWAQEEGIVKGVSDTEFAPNNKVTREQIATILWRYSGSVKAEADISDFKDTATISDYARDAIIWAVAEGILNGSDSKLSPTNNATRAEFACIIMRYLQGSYECK